MLVQEDLDLWPSDVVAFNRGVVLEGDLLIDQLTGTRLSLNGPAVQLLAAVDGKTSVEDCASLIAAEHGWDSTRVTNDFAAVIDNLERYSLLHIRRSFLSRLQRQNIITALSRLLSLDWPRPPLRRYPPNLLSLTLACLRATRWGLLAGMIVSCLLALVFTMQGLGQTANGWKLAYAFLPFILFLALVSHIIFHEAGHLAAMNLLAPQSSKYVLVRGLRISVAHSSLGPTTERAVAVAGPLAGLAGAQFIGLALLAVPEMSAVAPVINLSGFLHLYSFCPWTADGRMIWKRRP
ncbi:PqqD family protein [Arthrobacter sp. ISL-30]|uniref:PqqD family protein n=1 Tax=Arthrobacter sp. ISL-30 TaxID=2819109 RepID=UPI001BE62732|nr:PqqD family protein [Arthrobacter sp. ISL-30]MBT2513389.1 PqqD family protein [Arthrobacter sp. ISL-30]